jgi:hypothetical protein
MLTALAVATAALIAAAAPAGSARAEVYLPCAPNCTVDPCKLAPERCR